MHPTELAQRAKSLGNGRHGKQAVFLVHCPMDWKPRSCWDFPPRILAGELYVRNIGAGDAFGFARAFNQAALKAVYENAFDGRWALSVRHLRSRNASRHPDDHAMVVLCRNGSPEKIIRRYSKAEAAEFVAEFNALSEGTPILAVVEEGGGQCTR